MRSWLLVTPLTGAIFLGERTLSLPSGLCLGEVALVRWLPSRLAGPAGQVPSSLTVGRFNPRGWDPGNWGFPSGTEGPHSAGEGVGAVAADKASCTRGGRASPKGSWHSQAGPQCCHPQNHEVPYLEPKEVRVSREMKSQAHPLAGALVTTVSAFYCQYNLNSRGC